MHSVKPERCQSCTLFNEPGIVRGSGNRNAKIMLVGEAPGAEEVDHPRHRPEKMKPFIGGSGRILYVLCSHAGISRDAQTYTTNCVKCRPPNNRLPTELEIACCAPLLIEEIEDVNPNVIVALGEIALNVLADKKKIGLWRGVPIEGFAGRKVFPTWHPSFIIRSSHNWAFSVHDLARAKAESTFPEIRRIPIDVVRQADLTSTRGPLLRDIRERGACTFDFETTGLSADTGSIRMCGFVGRPDQALVYDWTVGAQQFFEDVFADDSIEIIGQNILSFDIPFAEDKGHKVRWTNVFDTMVAFHLCNSSYGQTSIAAQNAGVYSGARGAEKDLSFIASNHTDIPYWKSRDAYKNDLYEVCGLDCIATDRAALHPRDGLKEELRRYDMIGLYYDHVLPVHRVLRKMTQRGVNVDVDRATRWSLVLQREADELESTLKEGLGDPLLNLQSPKQLMELLYGKLGLPIQYNQDKKRGRVPTANAEALETLAQLAPENVILRSIVDIRHLRKMKSTFIEPIVQEGRVHARFGVSKASNGRFNSWNPNAQNIPEHMRDIWIPDSPDHVLVSADSSQIEWRNAMVLSGDPVGLELLASGVDNHRAVASEALGIPLAEVTDYQRHAAKFIVYGLGYGRGASSIAIGHNLPLPFVNDFIRKFFLRFRVFYNWRESLPAQVQKDHFLANPWKRRRWWWTREITEIYNFPASSCAADMMIDELIALDRELPAEATLRLTVHDEVVVNCPKDIVKDVALCMKTHMQQTWPRVVEASRDPETVKRFYPNGWCCPVDIHVGTNWKQCKSKDPEDQKVRAQLEKELGL